MRGGRRLRKASPVPCGVDKRRVRWCVKQRSAAPLFREKCEAASGVMAYFPSKILSRFLSTCVKEPNPNILPRLRRRTTATPPTTRERAACVCVCVCVYVRVVCVHVRVCVSEYLVSVHCCL